MTDEFELKLYPPEFAISPAYTIDRFNALIKKYGKEIVHTSYCFQKAREMWSTAVFLLALSKITDKTYWLQPEYEQATPDTYAFSIAPHPNIKRGKIQEKLNIEVTEYEEHSRDGLVAAIKSKLRNKHYPDYFLLLVQINRLGEIDVGSAFSELSKDSLGITEIWLLGGLTGIGKHVLACLRPQQASAAIELEKEVEANADQVRILKPSRGIGEMSPGLFIPTKLPQLPGKCR